METKNKALTNGISKLLELQVQRRDGYEKAIMECKGTLPELRLIFKELADESRQFIVMLTAKLAHLDAGKEPESEGEISRIWNHIKWAHTGINREGLLVSALESEEIIAGAYTKLLESDVEMSAETREMLFVQQESLKKDAVRIRLLENRYAVFSH